jgi:hypothetical protein
MSASGLSNADELDKYELIILPACDVLTKDQTDAFIQFADHGGKLLLFGNTAENLPGWIDRMKQHKNVIFCENAASKKAAMETFRSAFTKVNEQINQISVDNPLVGVHLQQNGNTHTIHLLNYNYDTGEDRVLPIPSLTVTVRIPEGAQGIELYTLDGLRPEHTIRINKDVMAIEIYDMPLYVVAEFISK